MSHPCFQSCPLLSVFNIVAKGILQKYKSGHVTLWFNTILSKSQSSYSGLQNPVRGDFSLPLWPHVLFLSSLLCHVHTITCSCCNILIMFARRPLYWLFVHFAWNTISPYIHIDHSLTHLLHIFEPLLKFVSITFSVRSIWAALFIVIMTPTHP